VKNPYFGQDLWGFFSTLAARICELFSGERFPLAADEVQVCVLLLVALSCGLVGTFLVLKRMTMLANALSHTVLPGLVVAYVLCAGGMYALDLTTLFVAALVTALLTVISVQLCTQLLRIPLDASIGIVSAVMVALGVVLVTLFTRNMHLGVEAITGNVDALHVDDVRIVALVAGLSMVVFLLFFKEFKLCAFDAEFGRVQGFSPPLFDYVLLLLTSLTVIAAFRAVGILLVLALLVAPPLTARLFSHRLRSVLWGAVGIGMGASLLSVAWARHLLSVHHKAVSTSGLLATVLGGTYAVVFLSVYVRKRWRKIARSRQTSRT
jgi:manganese/zinc/iron transport system permease protein